MPSITPHAPTKNHTDGMPDLNTVQRTARDASRQVSVELRKFTHLARANPEVSAAIILGAGMVLGAVVHRLISRPPSVGTLLIQALQDGATTTGHSLASGLASARRALK